jgi:hypothetical protein
LPDPSDESPSSEDARSALSQPPSDRESLHATPEEMSGFAKRRAAINEMRRAACFRLAELSRPVAASRATLKLPSAPALDADECFPIELPQLKPTPKPFAPEPASVPRAPRNTPQPTSDEPEIPSWLLRRNQISDSATTLGLLLIDFADSNIRRHLDLARALLTAKSLEEAIERHDSYMKSSLRIFEEQAAELQSLTGEDGEG